MNTGKLIIWAVFVAALLFSGQALAKQVLADGVGNTKDSAVKDAVRKALEQHVGTLIASETKVNMSQVDYDKIVSSTAGYVTGYDILDESRDPVENVWKVKIAANIDAPQVQGVVEQFLSDPRFQKTFQKLTFDQRRVVVLYSKRTPQDLDYHSKGVQTIMDLVQDRLVSYGFRVFLADQLKRIKRNLVNQNIDEASAIEAARQEEGDAVILVTIDAGARLTDDGMNIIYSTVSLKSYDCTTGELFANVQDRGKTLSRGGDYGLADGVARVAIDIGQRTSDELTKKIVERFSNKRDKFIVLNFKNVDGRTQYKLEKLVRDQGWEYRVSSQAGSVLELEISTGARPTDFRFEFMELAEKSGIHLTPGEAKGARITFSGR